MLIQRDIPYREAGDDLLGYCKLDLYYDPESLLRPKRTIVMFIHGGNWVGGDKKCFKNYEEGMPGWFVKEKHIFAAINFRLAGLSLSPESGIETMIKDIAKALKWLSINGRRWGGDVKEVIVIGFSSGAHLAMLLVTNQDYLRKFRIDPTIIKGVIVLDVPHLNVPMAIRLLEAENQGFPDQSLRLANLYRLFGACEKKQQLYSPLNYVSHNMSRMSFLMITTGKTMGHQQSFTRRMNSYCVAVLNSVGIQAEHHHLDNWEHVTLINKFGGELAEIIKAFIAKITK